MLWLWACRLARLWRSCGTSSATCWSSTKGLHADGSLHRYTYTFISVLAKLTSSSWAKMILIVNLTLSLNRQRSDLSRFEFSHHYILVRMFGPAWKHKIHRKLCSHTTLIPCTCTATQFLDYSLNRSVTCSMSYITHCIMFCLWLFVLSCFHRNSGWIAFCTMATATPVSIGRELPSLCWWCWDSSVAMAASQRAGRWTVLMNIYDTSIKNADFSAVI